VLLEPPNCTKFVSWLDFGLEFPHAFWALVSGPVCSMRSLSAPSLLWHVEKHVNDIKSLLRVACQKIVPRSTPCAHELGVVGHVQRHTHAHAHTRTYIHPHTHAHTNWHTYYTKHTHTALGRDEVHIMTCHLKCCVLIVWEVEGATCTAQNTQTPCEAVPGGVTVSRMRRKRQHLLNFVQSKPWWSWLLFFNLRVFIKE